MKKIFFIIIVITIISIYNDFNHKVIVPKESIRFRVIANSNSKEDQEIKLKVKENLEKDLFNLTKNKESINDVRDVLTNNISLFDNNIKKTLEENNSDSTYNISYGLNYFPKKTYKNVVYKEGKYESLVVRLGDGKGANFFCILFPPLCMLDEDENSKNVEYHILVKDILKKYFHKK